MAIHDLSLAQFSDLMSSKGVKSLYLKHLAANDNNKNQPYLGSDFNAIQILPNQGIIADRERGNFKAQLDFAWLDDDTNVNPAPHAKLILYPEYPEVRFSGFLRGVQ